MEFAIWSSLAVKVVEEQPQTDDQEEEAEEEEHEYLFDLPPPSIHPGLGYMEFALLVGLFPFLGPSYLDHSHPALEYGLLIAHIAANSSQLMVRGRKRKKNKKCVCALAT